MAADGMDTAVVSMPCWELFEQRPKDYCVAVLGTVLRSAWKRRCALWDRWIGPEGAFVGMSGFGASGKEEDLWRHFGITAEAVAAYGGVWSPDPGAWMCSEVRSAGVMLPMLRRMAAQGPSRLRSVAVRSNASSLTKAFSIGLKSGPQGGS